MSETDSDVLRNVPTSDVRPLPTQDTHRVVALIGLPADLLAVHTQLKALAAAYPGAVVVTGGELWRSDACVIATPRERL